MTINNQGRAIWYAPDGEQRIFEAGEEVPPDWKDHPQKIAGISVTNGDGVAGNPTIAPVEVVEAASEPEKVPRKTRRKRRVKA